jgi:hypothetical protein
MASTIESAPVSGPLFPSRYIAETSAESEQTIPSKRFGHGLFLRVDAHGVIARTEEKVYRTTVIRP